MSAPVMKCKHTRWRTHNERPLRRCMRCGTQEVGECYEGYFVFPDGTHVAVDQVAYCNALLREKDAQAETALEEGTRLHRKAEAEFRLMYNERGEKMNNATRNFLAQKAREAIRAECEHRFMSSTGGGFRCDTCRAPAKECAFKSKGVDCMTNFFGEGSLCSVHAKLKAEAETGGGLAQRFKDATSPGRLAQEIVTCDLGADYED